MSDTDQTQRTVLADEPLEAAETTDADIAAGAPHALSEDEVLGVAPDDDAPEAPPVIESAYDRPGQWYVVHLGPDWRPGAGGWVCKPDPPTALPIAAECLRG